MEKVELLLKDLKFDDLKAISIVQNPSIEENFLIFSKDTFAKINKDKQILTGPAMIPDRNINRGTDINYYFSKETVEKASEQFLTNNIKNFSIEHEMNVNDIKLIESWIIKDKNNDKSKALGFSNLNEGTWMVSLKIKNDEIWNFIKNEMKGFSIEGYFTQKIQNFKKERNILKEIKDIIDEYENK